MLRILRPSRLRKRQLLDGSATGKPEGRLVPDRPVGDPLGVTALGVAIALGLLAGGFSATIPAVLAAIAGWVFYRFGAGEHTVLRLFGAALTSRNAALLFLPLLAGGKNSPVFPDEASFTKLSLEAGYLIFGRKYDLPAHIAAVAGPDGLRRFADDGFAYLLSPLAALYGPQETLPAIRSASALAGALGVCALWWAGSKIAGRKAARRAAAVYAFFPTSIFWSSMALKESLASLLVVLGLGMVAGLSADLRKFARPARWAYLWVVWFLLLSIREHLVFVGAAMAIPAAAFLAWPSPPRRISVRLATSTSAAVIVALVASTALWTSGYGVLGKNVVASLDPAFLEQRVEMETRGGATIAPATPAPTAPPEDGRPPGDGPGSRLSRLARRLPETAVSVAFRPYPWEIPQGSLSRFAAPARLFIFPSQLAWYAALFVGILGGARLARRHLRQAFLLFGFPLALFFFYGLTQANLGTAFRLREVFVPIVLLAAAVPRRRRLPASEPSVAFVLPTLGPGGTESHVQELSSRIRAAGREVSLAVLSDPPEGAEHEHLLGEGVARACFAGRRSRYDLALPLRLARIIGTPDCYSTYLFAGNFWGGLASRISGAALVSNIRTTHPRTLIQRMLEPLVAGELAVCNSESVAAAARRRGIPPRRIRVLKNGLDVEAVRRSVRRNRDVVLERIGIPPDAFVACLPARFDLLKDQITAVEAFRLSSLAARPDAFLVLVGSAELPGEREYKQRVEAAADGLRGIVMLDFYRPLPELMAASDVVLLSSLHEGLPNVLLEAGALRKPAIATAVGGSQEVISDRITGVLVPPRNPAALAGALDELAADEALRRRMGEAAGERIESEFSIDTEIEGFLRLTAECIAEATRQDRPDTEDGGK